MLITIIGKRGTGKTTLTKRIIQKLKPDNLFIYDFLGEYQEYKADNVIHSYNNLSYVLKSAWNLSEKNKINLLVCDEVDLYGYGNRQLEFIYRYGRHRNISVIAISRRFYNLPVYIRALTEVFFIFKITEERDLFYLRQLSGKETVKQVKNLQKYKYIKLTL